MMLEPRVGCADPDRKRKRLSEAVIAARVIDTNGIEGVLPRCRCLHDPDQFRPSRRALVTSGRDDRSLHGPGVLVAPDEPHLKGVRDQVETAIGAGCLGREHPEAATTALE